MTASLLQNSGQGNTRHGGVILIGPIPNRLRIEPGDGHNDHDRGDWADGVRIPYFREALEHDAQWQ